MSADMLLSRVRAQGVTLWAENGNLRYRGAKGALALLLPELVQHKSELLALLSRQATPRKLDLEDTAEYLNERAAILEYEQGFTRPDAEKEAVRRAVLHFRLKELYGDPPCMGGGVVIGETVGELLADLGRGYGTRLLEVTP